MAMQRTFDVWSDTSHRMRHVSIATAERGEFAGLSYMTCDCPAGSTSFKPGKPCKHVRQVAERLGIEIPASGHFRLTSKGKHLPSSGVL